MSDCNAGYSIDFCVWVVVSNNHSERLKSRFVVYTDTNAAVAAGAAAATGAAAGVAVVTCKVKLLLVHHLLWRGGSPKYHLQSPQGNAHIDPPIWMR